jgi:hypothetical protein
MSATTISNSLRPEELYFHLLFEQADSSFAATKKSPGEATAIAPPLKTSSMPRAAPLPLLIGLLAHFEAEA